MYTITIGADPEQFLIDQEGRYVSGHDLIPGSKEEPHFVIKGAIQRDGTALEFNINPALTAEEFVENISTVMEELTKEYKKVRPDLTIALTPVAYFDKEYFENLPEEAQMLGCMPDYNAYTGQENEIPYTEEPFRTAAGHIHVGWGHSFSKYDSSHFSMCCHMVQNLDASLYPASLLWDSDQKRRELYGKIGAFRPKSYGVEYRPLSNAFLKRREIQMFVFDMTKAVSDLVLNQGLDILDDVTEEVVCKFLNGFTMTSEEIRRYMNYLSNTYNLPNPEEYSV